MIQELRNCFDWSIGNDIGDDGAIVIGDALKKNSTLKIFGLNGD